MALGLPIDLVSEQEALAAGIALPAVSIIVVFLRFATRRWQGTRYGPDDWLILAALIFLAGMGACIIVAVIGGLHHYDNSRSQQHLQNTTFARPGLSLDTISSLFANSTAPMDETEMDHIAYEMALKSVFSFQLLMYPMNACAKLSILYFYRRVFWPQAYRALGIATQVVGGLVVLWSLAFFVFNIFDCHGDISLNWAPVRQRLHFCYTDVRLEQTYSIGDLILNVLLLLLPLPTVHRLQLTLRRRLAIGCVVLLGSCAIGASAIRVVLLVCLFNTDPSIIRSIMAGSAAAGYGSGSALDEHTANTAGVLIGCTMLYWSLIEAGLALQTACLPTLCVLLPGKVLGSSTGGRVGSLVTQVEVGGHDRYTSGTMTGPGHGYGRSSGWFARPMALAAGGEQAMAAVADPENLNFHRVYSRSHDGGNGNDDNDTNSDISELDLDAPSDDGGCPSPLSSDHRERGRPRERVEH